MATLRLTLQKDVFQPSGDERLIGLVNVTKQQKKKKKTCFLCIVSNIEKRVYLIYKVKKYDLQYKKRHSWQLTDLKTVDGKNANKETNEFDLHFSGKQIYKWLASSVQEKNSFIQLLWKISNEHLPLQKPNFINIAKSLLFSPVDRPAIEIQAPGFDGTTNDGSTNGISNFALEEESYQALTSREEADLERLMEQCEFTIHNAEAFTEQLSREVASMDSVNIQSIMASEQRVAELMGVLQIAVDETSRLEQRIDHYENLLKNVRDTVEHVGQKEALVQIQNENSQKLLVELEYLINNLDLPQDHEFNLLEGDLATINGIDSCYAAAIALQAALSSDIHPALNYIHAVQDQKRNLERIQAKFSSRFCFHLQNLLKYLINEYSDSFLGSMNSRDLALPNHSLFHNSLTRYSNLIKWLKVNNKEIYSSLMKNYVNIMSNQYEREILLYFELAKEKLSGSRLTIGSGTESMDSRKRNSGAFLQEMSRNRSGSSQGANLDFLDSSSSRSSEISMSEWEEFDSCIERMLNTIDPIYLSEQQFCLEFFDIEGNILPANLHLPQQRAPSSSSHSISPSPSNLSQNSNEVLDARKSEALRQIMSELFLGLEPEFINFASYYDKLDGLYSMYLLVRLSQHVMSAQDTGSFLAKTYGSILIHVKRNFDRFMTLQLSSIEEAKVTKKPKCGVLPFIKKFEQFAKQAEGIFRTSNSRRTDIDRWYNNLIRAIFDAINRLANEHHKTPSEMVRLENYHYLHDVMCTIKIACLENEKKEAKQRYNEALKDYVARYFGRPLEKLNAFFEGVQLKVSQGVKEEEVGYQLAFSKQELRKVIRDCSLKEVKRGLEEMYRKVEKHTCEPDSTLIQVIIIF